MNQSIPGNGAGPIFIAFLISVFLIAVTVFIANGGIQGMINILTIITIALLVLGVVDSFRKK
jgi:VIT1/CCC1 family predicted Fe2+/Mn2+ transporter